MADKDGKPIADPAYLEGGQVMRLSIDCKATVKIGEYSRGGKTRADTQAIDHDMGCQEKQVSFGIVEKDSGQLPLTFESSFKTSDFIVDGLEGGWQAIPREKQAVMTHIQLKVDNGPESNGDAHPVPQAHGRVRRCDWQNHPTAVLSTIPQQVQSHRTRLGNLGTALE
ncbi:hypothetical protein [Nitrosomonas sp. Nm34]|uniref:ISAzo13-like element transposase-related protein n=1 Tax=Nitrosomonas sp. Nm34 TaxID=1881055 RepID=UPI0020C92997|nr:hypothetical protein [Nitrosomonas sp. Nm34]